MHLKSFRFCLLTFIGIVFLSSCIKEENTVYSQFYDFDEALLTRNDDCVFLPFKDVPLKDTTNFYSIFLSVRYSNLCNKKELPLMIEWSSMEIDSIFQREISISLFDNEDLKKGKGDLGISESCVCLLPSIKYQYELSINIIPNVNSMKGILSLGIILKKHETYTGFFQARNKQTNIKD